MWNKHGIVTFSRGRLDRWMFSFSSEVCTDSDLFRLLFVAHPVQAKASLVFGGRVHRPAAASQIPKGGIDILTMPSAGPGNLDFD